MPDRVPASREVTRERVKRTLAECGCVACRAMLAVNDALDDHSLGWEQMATLAGYMDGAAQAFLERSAELRGSDS